MSSKEKEDYSRRKEIGSPLIESLMPKLPSETMVVIVRLQSMESLPFSPSSLSGTADPFMEMKLQPADDVAGHQLQRSSVKPSSLNPKWVRIDIHKRLNSYPHHA